MTSLQLDNIEVAFGLCRRSGALRMLQQGCLDGITRNNCWQTRAEQPIRKTALVWLIGGSTNVCQHKNKLFLVFLDTRKMFPGGKPRKADST